jgi:hypothetical protein
MVLLMDEKKEIKWFLLDVMMAHSELAQVPLHNKSSNKI